MPVVQKGLRARLRKRLNDLIAADGDGTEPAGIEIRWSPELRDDEVFRVEPDEPAILLNDEFRPTILGGAAASPGDAPIFKTLLFCLLKDDTLKSRITKQLVQRHELWNACLLAAVSDAQ